MNRQRPSKYWDRNKTGLAVLIAGTLIVLGFVGTKRVAAQQGGSLTPPGGPAPSMASLQEIYDKICNLKDKVDAQANQIAALEDKLDAVGDSLDIPDPMSMVVVGATNATPIDSGPLGVIGGVPYRYRISTEEVTNGQFAEFLNAVAVQGDQNQIYHPQMGGNPRGGITQTPSGTAGFQYEVKPFMDDKPVVFVDYWSTLRYCNWLHNGKPDGTQNQQTTEDGAYTLFGRDMIQLPGSDPQFGAHGRNEGARFCLPNLDEWQKAAYYHEEPQVTDVTTNHWATYPARSVEISTNLPPRAFTDSTGGLIVDIETGRIWLANWNRSVNWNGLQGNVSTVGSGAPLTLSGWGVSDMGGNAAELVEDRLLGENPGGGTNFIAIVRGGSWADADTNTLSFRGYDMIESSLASDTVGFRVISP